MSKIEDGGPAFPVIHEQYDFAYEQKIPKQVAPGMTLRDYFAAKVISGLLVACSTNQRAAEEAYAIADAMLRAREQS